MPLLPGCFIETGRRFLRLRSRLPHLVARRAGIVRRRFRVGASVRMVGDEWSALHGQYTVTDVRPDAVTLGGAAGPSVVLSPRHRWLADSDGNAVDPWNICNVFVDGAHITIGIVKPGTPPDDVRVELGS